MKASAIQYRKDYLRIKRAYDKLAKGNARVSQSDIVLIQPIDPNRTNYTFPVLETENANNPYNDWQIKLNMNDEFVVLQQSVTLWCRMEQTDRYFAMSYPPVELDATAHTLYQLYHTGRLSVKVNNVVFLEKYAIDRHLNVPRTQWENIAATTITSSQPSLDFSADSWFSSEPNIVLSGAKKNEIDLSLARSIQVVSGLQFSSQAEADLDFNIVGIRLAFRGFLAQNAASFQD